MSGGRCRHVNSAAQALIDQVEGHWTTASESSSQRVLIPAHDVCRASNQHPASVAPQTSIFFSLTPLQPFSSIFHPTSFRQTTDQLLSGALCFVLVYTVSQPSYLHTAATSPSWAAKLPGSAFACQNTDGIGSSLFASSLSSQICQSLPFQSFKKRLNATLSN